MSCSAKCSQQRNNRQRRNAGQVTRRNRSED
jgi:hypothetical protein